MKTGIKIAIMVAFIIVLSSGFAFADESVKLRLDGTLVETDVPPIIENGRTLVPYRALLESMGAEVSWEQEAEMATAILGSHRVQVTIDKTTAFVNGVIKEMDVPPRIINGRTMIPIRFVLENLQCKVGWDNVSRTVIIDSPKMAGLTEVNTITYEETDNCYRIIARGADLIKGTRTFAFEKPERYGVDILNAVLPERVGAIAANNELFANVRYSQFDGGTVRIVVDLNDKIAGEVSMSEDRSMVFIDFAKSKSDNTDVEDENSDYDDPENSEPDEGEPTGALPELDWRVSKKLIAIDAGHGGKDPGSAGKINGLEVLAEKDLNLSIALRLHQLLTQAGANVTLLRDSDITMALYSRPEAANLMNADILVSVHNNSAESSAPNGTEVLYYDKVGQEAYGISSKEIAAYVQKELLKEIGLKDRGIKNSPHLAVLNKSIMPAIIIEGGFLSNPDDLRIMLTEEYKEAYALAAARGIINALNDWAER